jgi:nucleoside-diphosphate-sugar epimerase
VTSKTCKTAFVTGSAGFIGTHLCKALAADGWKVIGYDWKTGGAGKDIRTCPLPEADMCFHLAAQSDAHSKDVWADATHNIMATLRVLEKYKSNVVFASSASIHYPVTPYAVAKLACEHYCRLYGARIVRKCNITGPGGHGVFEKFAAARILKIAGSGEQRREYATVHKAVEAYLRAANLPLNGEVIVSGVQLSVLDIADLFHPDKPREFVERSSNDLYEVLTNLGGRPPGY